MNFLKDLVLGLVGLIALNSMGYLAMNTSMGYDIIVYGCIVVVELLVLMWFVKWIRPRAESVDDEYDDYDDYDYDDDCHCGDCLNDTNEYKASLDEARQNLDDAIAYLDRIMASSPRADESATNVDSETMKRPAREECEDNSENDADVVETVEPENESDTTSLDDLINEVKSF